VRRHARHAALLMIAATAGGASCAGAPREEIGAESQPIIGGSPDTTDTAVVAVVQPNAGILCSGTLVAPNIVLTAAHCLYGVEASALQVLVGADRTDPDQTVAVTSVVVYPTYTSEGTGLTGGVDLGVVYLATPLTITPIALNTTATDAELTGADVTLVGYGVSSTTDESQVGVRMSVSLPVSTVCSRILTLGSADANECSGDSGGAVLLGGQLVAVISSGSLDCIAPSNQTRLSAHALWLESVLHGDASASCPDCVEPDPSCTALVEGQSAPSEAGTGDGSGAASGGGGGCAVVPAPTRRAGGALAPLFFASLAVLRWRRRQRR